MNPLTKCQCHKPAGSSQISEGIPNRVAALSSTGRLLADQGHHRPNCIFSFLLQLFLPFHVCIIPAISTIFNFSPSPSEQMSSTVTPARTVQQIATAGTTRIPHAALGRDGPLAGQRAFSRIDHDSLNAGIGAIGSV